MFIYLLTPVPVIFITPTIFTVTKSQIYWILYECELSWLWTLLLYVHVSGLHEHSSTLDTVFHINTCYTEHCYFIYMYHCYTWYYYFLFMSHWYADTIFHRILLFHIFVLLLHGYCVHKYFMFIHLCYIDSPAYMRWLLLYSYCMNHYLYYRDYCCMDILVFSLHDCFP